MELKSISFLRNNTSATEEAINNYASELIENYGWEEFQLKFILKEIGEIPEEIMNSNRILGILKAFIVENYNEITYTIIPSEKKFVSETNLGIFEWTYKGTTHILVLDSDNMEQLRVLILLLDSGSYTDDGGVRPISYFRENYPSWWTETSNFIIRLGLMGNEPVVPIPSESLDIDESTARFSSAVWFEEIQKKVITLAGVGGIGSYVGFLLSRMKPQSVYIYDNDVVETVNMAGQLYSSEDVLLNKVDALAAMMVKYSNFYNIVAKAERFTEESPATDIMICGFDNMEARKTFFQSWIAHVEGKSEDDRRHCLFIDGRLAAEEFQVFCIRGDDTYNIVKYAKEFLFSDEEADETLCSYKQTSYMANMIGSIMVNLFTNFVANEITEHLRDLPFFTSYDGSSMMFKTEQ